MRSTYYGIQYTNQRDNGKLVALDAASGGYPYAVDESSRAQMWRTVEERDRYMNMAGLPSAGQTWKPVTITIEVTD